MSNRLEVYVSTRHVCSRWVRGGVFDTLLSNPTESRGSQDLHQAVTRADVEGALGVLILLREDEQR